MKKIYEKFCKIEVGFCCVGFILLVILVFGSAILRFMRVSMAWNIDLAMLLLAWTAFLGADVAWRSGQLIGIDLVTRYFPKKSTENCLDCGICNYFWNVPCHMFVRLSPCMG